MQLKTFTQAWISDVEYEYRQNAYSILQYTSAGREHSHLPKKSNGLPFPVEETIIDTSLNPGRMILRDGYVEVVASTMWLGKRFWECVGTVKKHSLLDAKWIHVDALENEVVKLTAAEHCFVDVSTSEIQNKLRDILYS